MRRNASKLLILLLMFELSQGARFSLPDWLPKNPASISSTRAQLEAHEMPIISAIGTALSTETFKFEEAESLKEEESESLSNTSKISDVKQKVLHAREELSIYSPELVSELETSCTTLVGPCPQIFLDALFVLSARRVRLGIDVAVAKYIADPVGFFELAKANDTSGILRKLTNSGVELAVIVRVQKKATEVSWFGKNLEIHAPSADFASKCAHFFENTLIPLTKTIEVLTIKRIVEKLLTEQCGMAGKPHAVQNGTNIS